MPRLKALGKRIASMAPRLGHIEGDRKAYDRQRDQASPARAWYRTNRWKTLRVVILNRDGWRCAETGVALVGKGNAPNAPAIHHRKPHNNNPQLFWNPDNLVAVSKAWHDTEGQKADRAQGHW